MLAYIIWMYTECNRLRVFVNIIQGQWLFSVMSSFGIRIIWPLSWFKLECVFKNYLPWGTKSKMSITRRNASTFCAKNPRSWYLQFNDPQKITDVINSKTKSLLCLCGISSDERLRFGNEIGNISDLMKGGTADSLTQKRWLSF